MKQHHNYIVENEEFMAKHPQLLDMTILTLDQAGIDFKALSEFIEMCWNHYYGRALRIRFSSGFLKWNMGKTPTGIVVLNNVGSIIGVIFYLKRSYLKDGIEKHYAIETGLSVHPDYRGMGVGQLLYMNMGPVIKESGVDFSLEWYDIRRDKAGSSFQILAADKENTDDAIQVRIFLRIIDFNMARKHFACNDFDAFSLKLKTIFFPAPVNRLMSEGYILEEFKMKRMDAYCEFLERYQKTNHLRVIPTAGELMKFQPGRYTAARFYALLEKRSGQIQALYFGHKVPLDEEWFYFQADGILTGPDLAGTVASTFLGNAEARLAKEGPCMGVIVSETGCGDGLWKYGYFTVVKQFLVMVPKTALLP